VELRGRADEARAAGVGPEVHLRGLLELSSHCARDCHYCGLRAANRGLPRFRMRFDEILAGADLALQFGYGTVVLQAGEDPGLDAAWLARLIRALKARGPLAVALSLGELPLAELALLREAGADRSLLRFEPSADGLYRRLHPGARSGRHSRIELLAVLRRLGYEVGTGFLVGLPGQSLESLADDLLVLASLEPDMVGIGPFLPHPGTPLGGARAGSTLLALKTVALARLLCPRANIPSTSALGVAGGRAALFAGLRWGANVVMPDLTPAPYRTLYEIYPGKGRGPEPGVFHGELLAGLEALGRLPGAGRGDGYRGVPAGGKGVA